MQVVWVREAAADIEEKIDRFTTYTGRFLTGLDERVYGEEEGCKAGILVSE